MRNNIRIYEIKTESGDFTYKGGIVLGNSSYKQPDLDLNGTIDFIWGQDPSCQNDMLIKFHSEVPYEPSTASTSST